MKILVIGCGSIGQRHIKNLITLNGGQILAFDIDEEKLKGVRAIHVGIEISANLDELWDKNPEVVFITVPTSLHMPYAIEAARRGCHIFIEKPISNDLRHKRVLLKLVREKKLITMVGCNWRFYWAIAKMKKLLEQGRIGRIVSARIETGEYLPDWHPQEDYRKMYSARRDLGGGVLLDAIHEIDYATWFLGEVAKITAMYGKLTSLKIETEDTAEIILKFKNGPLVNIHMDYIQRAYARSCKIIGEEGTLFWDINEHVLKCYSAKTKNWTIFIEPKAYHLNQIYIDEVKYFLRCVKSKTATFNDVSHGFKALEVVLKALEEGK